MLTLIILDVALALGLLSYVVIATAPAEPF
jgi:hypothetical protein